MAYREQEFVEHCFCRSAAVGPCDCCGRARCAEHLERGLCNRCHQAVTRDIKGAANRSWVLGGTVFAATSFALLAAHVAASVLVGLPLGLGVAFAHRRWRRRRTIRALGPLLAASTGELPPEHKEYGGYGPEPTWGRVPPP